MLIAFSSRSPCCYSPSVAPPFTSGLSCPGAVSICAGEPDQAQEVMDYIQHRYFISIQNRLEFRCRRQLPKLFLKKWQTGICTATAHHAADKRWSVRLRPCTAAHSRAPSVDTSKNDGSCTGYTRKGKGAEGPPDAYVLHGVLTSVVQINRWIGLKRAAMLTVEFRGYKSVANQWNWVLQISCWY